MLPHTATEKCFTKIGRLVYKCLDIGMGDRQIVFGLQQKFPSFSKRPDQLPIFFSCSKSTKRISLMVKHTRNEMKLTPQLHVVLKVRMPEATVCTVPYAFRVWGLMKLKNKVITSPFFDGL